MIKTEKPTAATTVRELVGIKTTLGVVHAVWNGVSIVTVRDYPYILPLIVSVSRSDGSVMPIKRSSAV